MNVYGELISQDVPWLSEAPITGTVAADSSFPVDISFTPAITMTPGVYTATLKIKTDDPVGGLIEVPVTMNVVQYGIQLKADAIAKSGLVGDIVTYNVTITNTSLGASDSFDLSLLPGYVFPSALSTTSTPDLAPGESATVQVMVTIPEGALGGDKDMVTLKVTSHNNPTNTAEITFTTTVLSKYIFLPFIGKN